MVLMMACPEAVLVLPYPMVLVMACPKAASALAGLHWGAITGELSLGSYPQTYRA
jgi:hypothetical protein